MAPQGVSATACDACVGRVASLLPHDLVSAVSQRGRKRERDRVFGRIGELSRAENSGAIKLEGFSVNATSLLCERHWAEYKNALTPAATRLVRALAGQGNIPRRGTLPVGSPPPSSPSVGMSVSVLTAG